MKKKIIVLFMVILVCFILLCGCSKKQEEVKVHVFIAASLSNVMTEVKDLYEKDHPNVEIVYNADSSGTLKTQIEEGAECDVFFSAATKQMDALMEGGYIEKDSVVELLENKVVLIKPKDMESTVTGFDNIINANSIALAGEDVPVGAYAREIMTSMGIIDDVMKMEINECSNVSAVLAAVSEASNEVGIVYSTDAYSALDSVDIIAEAPKEFLSIPVIYPVGRVVNEEAGEATKNTAKDFITYLQSEEIIKVFEEYGFVGYNK